MAGWTTLVIDYDTENAEDREITSIPQENGGTATAIAYLEAIQDASIGLDQVLTKLLLNEKQPAKGGEHGSET